jgi:hypothetical protein
MRASALVVGLITRVRGHKEPVMIKEGPLYYNDSTGWKKLYSLQSDARLGFSERQEAGEDCSDRPTHTHTRTRLASPSC